MCVLSVDGSKQEETLCWVKRNIIRATIVNDIPAASQVRLDVLTMFNPEAADILKFHVFVMNNTAAYTAGWHYS